MSVGRPARLSAQQIGAILRQAEAGTPVQALCREHGISDTSFYRWRLRDQTARPPPAPGPDPALAAEIGRLGQLIERAQRDLDRLRRGSVNGIDPQKKRAA